MDPKLIPIGVCFVAAIAGVTFVYFFVRNSKKRKVVFHNSETKVPLRLVDKEIISHDTRRFRFALPANDECLGVPIGNNITVSARINDSLVVRPYTPVTDDDLLGYVDLVIKIYFSGADPRFPDGGKMSQYIDNMQIGDFLDFRGPFGLLSYNGKSEFNIRANRQASPTKKIYKNVGMIAGGTGITPMYHLIQYILKHSPIDTTKLSLLFANKTEADILMRDKLEELREKYPNQFNIWYTLSGRSPSLWSYSLGYVNADMIKEHLPAPGKDTLILICGPPPMVEQTVIPTLDSLGYAAADRYIF